MTLFADGRIQLLYGDVEPKAAIVGISPGGGSALDLLDYDIELPHPPLAGAIAEHLEECGRHRGLAAGDLGKVPHPPVADGGVLVTADGKKNCL